jgi:hypothetical protein
MRTAFALILILMTLAACQGGPAGPGPARDPATYDRHGGMCSPYASNCW